MRALPVVLCLALSLPAWCDDENVEDLVNRALEAYREGKKNEAADLLQKAASIIQKEGEQGFATFAPAAPEGWTRGEVQSDSGTWGSSGQTFQWMQVSAEYTKGDTQLTLTISSSPQLLEAQKGMVTMMQNEQYLKAMNMDPDRKVTVFSRDGWSGWTEVEKEGRVSRFAITDKLMCQLEMPAGDEATINQFSDLLDWKGLAGAVR